MKNNNILKCIALFFAGGFILAACNKDDKPAPDKTSKLLYNWKITSIMTNKVGQTALDSSVFNACMNDDVVKFTSTGFDFQDGTVKCDSTVFKYSKGNWAYKIASDSIQLASTTPVKYASWKVLTLNDSILKVQYVDSTIPAKKVNQLVSFKH